MHKALTELCDSLEDLAITITKSWGETRTLKDLHGWNHPPLTKEELAELPQSIVARLEELDINEIDKKIEEKILSFPQKAEQLKRDTIVYIFNGNAPQALPAYLATMSWLSLTLEPLFSWETLKDTKAMPHQMAKRLRTLKAEIDQLTPDKDELLNHIKSISEATQAAESLPTDLQALEEARTKVQKISDDAIRLHTAIEHRESETLSHEEKIKKRSVEADKIVSQCEDAYRITTTKGLAAGFDSRASKLGQSMWVWVTGLVLALGIGAYMGSQRITSLSGLLSNPEIRSDILLVQILLSIFSVGAPLWFAWVSTKQISQRFRLAEDYAFKASVAKAYEGYRKEAARIDESFEARLFGSALSRLEEAPLRLVEGEHHGTPFSELVNSPAFQKALNLVPELRDKFLDLSKAGIATMTQDRRSNSARFKKENNDEETT